MLISKSNKKNSLRISVCRSFARLVSGLESWPVSQVFLKGLEVTLPSSYRSTCSPFLTSKALYIWLAQLVKMIHNFDALLREGSVSTTRWQLVLMFLLLLLFLLCYCCCFFAQSKRLTIFRKKVPYLWHLQGAPYLPLIYYVMIGKGANNTACLRQRTKYSID